MAGRLSPKVAIVTGSTGIGRAAASRLVGEGGAVVARQPGTVSLSSQRESAGRSR